MGASEAALRHAREILSLVGVHVDGYQVRIILGQRALYSGQSYDRTFVERNLDEATEGLARAFDAFHAEVAAEAAPPTERAVAPYPADVLAGGAEPGSAASLPPPLFLSSIAGAPEELARIESMLDRED